MARYNLALFRNRNVGLLWFATFISSSGDWMFYTAISYAAFATSGSVEATSTVFIAQTVPRVVLGSFAGVLADRLDRKLLLVVSDLARAVVVLLVVWIPLRHLFLVDVVIGAEATLTLVFLPARVGLLPAFVEVGQLTSANALLQVGQTLSQFVGPVLGAFLLVQMGLPGVVISDTASYVLSALALGIMAVPSLTSQNSQPPGKWFAQWRDGVLTTLGRPWLRGIAVSMFLVLLADGSLSVGVVAYVRTVLHQTALGYGALRSAGAVGSFAAGLLLTGVGRHLRPNKAIPLGMVGAGLILTGLFVLHTFPTTVILYGAFSLANVLWVVNYGTLLQAALDPTVLGRVSAFLGSLQGLGMLAGLGLLDALISSVPLLPILVGFGVLVIVAGGVGYVALRVSPNANAKTDLAGSL
jgi:hypothetical protein